MGVIITFICKSCGKPKQHEVISCNKISSKFKYICDDCKYVKMQECGRKWRKKQKCQF